MPANLRTCADCSTEYALDLPACPHCGSSNSVEEDGAVVTKRLPLFITVSCPECGRGPWTVRLNAVKSGLIELPTLACASCGNQVPVTWPPKEEDMPKNHVGRAPTDATELRDADSPAVGAEGSPQVVAEDDLGTTDPAEGSDEETVEQPPAEENGEAKDGDPYAGLTLAELKAEADTRNVPSYGTKAQITERLREADAEAAAEKSAE